MLLPARETDSSNNQPSRSFRLSIIIPAWNESAQIAETIRALVEFATRTQRCIELLLVDDGSTDATLDAALAAHPAGLTEPRFLTPQFLRHDVNRGKGAATRTGLAAATGERILICDADLSTPLDELPRLEAALADGADIAIASRDLPKSRLNPPQPLHRRLLAWTLRSVRRRILLPEVRDTQCGFKLLSRRAVNAILHELTIDGWLYDCELLGVAAEKGFRIVEIAVTWHDRRDSRVRPLRDLIPTIRELFVLRRRFRSRRK